MRVLVREENEEDIYHWSVLRKKTTISARLRLMRVISRLDKLERLREKREREREGIIKKELWRECEEEWWKAKFI